MKLAIIGGRDFADSGRAMDLLIQYFDVGNINCSISTIVTGCASGADAIARDMAKEFSLNLDIHKANWTQFGKAAGPMRNAKIVENADMILAFWDGQSRGTKDSITKARLAKKDTMIFYY